MLSGCWVRGGRELGWLILGLYFHFFTGGISPGVHTIMAVAAPRADFHASGGDYFVCQVRDECLGVEWGGFMVLCCFLFLAGGVGLGVRSILEISAPWADILATSGDCFVCWGWSECLGVEWGFCLGFGFF